MFVHFQKLGGNWLLLPVCFLSSAISYFESTSCEQNDAHHGRALFYYFVEAESANHLSLPWTLWLNGGPGCSSLGFGAFMEHGPFQPGENGLLVKNEYSWNLESNVLYVESPIGVGFSNSNTTSDYTSWNDTTTAEDNLRFIVNWLDEFPQYKDSELFLTGESYAGHYVPQLANLIMEYNKQPNIKSIKLKAIALGNPLLDFDISMLAGDYLRAHGVMSDEILMLERTVCNESKYLPELVHNQLSQGCIDVFNRVEEEFGDDVDSGDLLLLLCTMSSSTYQFKPNCKHGKIHKMYNYGQMAGGLASSDPCLDIEYLLISTSLKFNKHFMPTQPVCLTIGTSIEDLFDYQEDNFDTNIIPLVSDLVKGIPLLLYSGDQD